MSILLGRTGRASTNSKLADGEGNGLHASATASESTPPSKLQSRDAFEAFLVNDAALVPPQHETQDSVFSYHEVERSLSPRK